MKNKISLGLLVISALGFGLGAQASDNGNRVFSCGGAVIAGNLNGSTWHLQDCHIYSLPDGPMFPTSSHDAIDLGECTAQARGALAAVDYSTNLTSVLAEGLLSFSGADAAGRLIDFTIDLNSYNIDAYGVVSPYRNAPFYKVSGLAGVKYCSDFTNVRF